MGMRKCLAGLWLVYRADCRADAQRIYVMGMSTGALMSLRLALQMTPRSAAVAAHFVDYASARRTNDRRIWR
jgi:poly(3-hydroxybutyrate) depolymerase